MFLDKLLYKLVRPAFRKWRETRFRYTRLVEVFVYKDHLLHNAEQVQQVAPTCGIAPVLKSNAYGHGLVEVARVFDRPGTAFLVVDGYYEALILRNEGVRAGILVIGYTATENIVASRLNDVAFTILDLPQLLDLSDTLAVPRRFHLKVDTGMNRQGLLRAEMEQAFDAVKKNEHLILEGLCSHLADADGADETFTAQQIERWNEVVAAGKSAVPSLKFNHLANTAGSFYADRIDANVMRIGLGLYGINPNPRQPLDLKPTLDIRSRVGAVKGIEKGAKVGYNVTYEAERDLPLAIVPTGYNSCVDRRLSNKGFFKVKDTMCPIVGKISMNITTVDAGAVDDVQKGDVVTVVSARKEDENSVENIARICDTIPYVILVNISPHLRRVVV